MYGRGAPIAAAPSQTAAQPVPPQPRPTPHSGPSFVSASPLENSGSLTGHILSQGSWDVPPPKSRTAKVVAIILVIIILLVGGGAAAAIFAEGFVNDLFGGLLEE